MRIIPGGCHCGAIRYEFTWPVPGREIPVRACSCAFCTKHRACYTSHADAVLDVMIADKDAVSAYTFATGTAEFQVCRRCGVVPFVTSRIEGRMYAVVNVNTFEGDEASTLTESTSNFDGESLDQRLARRARTWIPTVSVTYGSH